MIQHSTIRRVSAGIMMLVFALSISPKQLLHNIFANHKDISYDLSGNESSKSQVNKAGINCQCENIVSESPFIDANDLPGIQIPTFFPEKNDGYFTGLYSISKFFSEFRGPPSIA